MRRYILLCLLLAGIALTSFWPVGRLGLITYDDPEYVAQNEHVQAGLSPANLAWAFTSYDAENWHPLTWLSLMLDRQLFGPPPAGMHWVNLALHALNSVLLFLFLRQLTGAVWRSFFVAALLACHPLNIQSVAWIAERKNVLSLSFALLTLMAYTRYGRHKSWGNYLATLVLMALGLMAKPVLVTLPIVMLLLDFWPLGRNRTGNSETAGMPLGLHVKLRALIAAWKPLLLEKIPFCLLALADSIFTSQAEKGGIQSLTAFSVQTRLLHAFYAYTLYLGKIFWPVDLAIFYPYTILPTTELVFAVLLPIVISLLIFRQHQSRPYLFVGWFWFVLTLVPMIGLVQVGSQTIADRHTYFTAIGLFIALAWGMAEIAARSPAWRAGMVASAGVVLLCLMADCRHQLVYWKDSVTIFSRAVAVSTSARSQGYFLLGRAYHIAGNPAKALEYFAKAMQECTIYKADRLEWGSLLLEQSRFEPAEKQFREILRYTPRDTDALTDLAYALVQEGNIPAAIKKYRLILILKPDATNVDNYLAKLLTTSADDQRKNTALAIRYARHACELTQFKQTDYLDTLAAAYAEAGRFADAIPIVQKACASAAALGETNQLEHNQMLLSFYQHQVAAAKPPEKLVPAAP